MAANEQVQKYYDALIASYDILVDAVGRANERGSRIVAMSFCEPRSW